MERRHPYHVLCGPVHGGHRDYERASEGATLLHDAQWLVPQARGSATPSREPWRVDGRGGGSAGLASGGDGGRRLEERREATPGRLLSGGWPSA